MSKALCVCVCGCVATAPSAILTELSLDNLTTPGGIQPGAGSLDQDEVCVRFCCHLLTNKNVRNAR